MFKTLSSKKVFKGKIFEITEEQILGPDGESTYQYITHPGAVMIIPQDQDGNYYMIRQYRHPIKEEIFEFPAGLIEPDEDLEICAQRELQEEINKAAGKMEYIGMIYTVPGYSNEKIYIYKATGLYDSILEKDKNEVITPEKYSAAQIHQLIKDNKILDAKTICAVTLLNI